jgi:methionyl-tRNA formyltransferase
MPTLRVVFMGTAKLACASLEALTRDPEFSVASAVTRPDRPAGRDYKPRPSPVKEASQKLGLPLLQPEKARDENFIAELRNLSPDIIVVAAYGQILPSPILDLPRFGCVNVHTSLLPKYRGAAPIQWAILNDDAETGITIMKMDPGLDTGDILSQKSTPIEAADNSETLHDRLATLGADLLVTTLKDLVAGRISPRKQPAEGVSIARKITKEDGLLDWKLPARTLWNRIRAFTPWPGAFTHLAAKSPQQLLKIWAADVVDQTGVPGEVLQASKDGIVVACGSQALNLNTVQLEGGKRMKVADFLAGHRFQPGDRLGAPV